MVNQPGVVSSKLDDRVEDSASPPDSVIIEQAKAGDQQAFRLLFDRYHRRAFAVAVGVVKNRHDATDIVQEAFVKVHRNLHGFAGSSSFYTWFYRILMNLAIDHIRKQRTRRRFDFDEKAPPAHATELPCTPTHVGHAPDHRAERRELSAQLTRALGEIPSHHRSVILLREVEGLSYAEIAEVLDVPKGTVMSRLFHARKRLQLLLEPYLLHGDDNATRQVEVGP